MRSPHPTAIALGLAFLLVLAAPAAAAKPITLDVDARDAARKLFHAHLVIPASPGALTLRYPKWIPGEHGPDGPITDLAGLALTAHGKQLAWRRDPKEMYAIHTDVPAGASAITVDLDFLSTTDTDGYSSAASATETLALVSWNELVLYPDGAKSDDITVAATLALPPAWTYATALTATREAKGRIEFAPVTLTTLVDSPVLAGAHFAIVPLAKGDGHGGAPARLAIAADSDEATAVPSDVLAAYAALVAEANALFGAHHYAAYTFLVTLSDHTAHFGLEHHESSDDRMPEGAFVDADVRPNWAGLLAHELVHSWNGKYRRPAGLATGDYDTPMDGELLWVYEGLTQHLGWLLAARSGLITAEQYQQELALAWADMEAHPGRAWRPLADTATAAQLGSGGDPWNSRRRGLDYYPEGDLIWLEVDTILRAETKGAKTLDDFCQAFHGGESGGPRVVPYTRDDVIATLAKLAPYDWKAFFAARIDGTSEHAPAGGIVASGWRVGFGDDEPQMLVVRENARHVIDERSSIGLVIGADDAMIRDVVAGSAADKAGLGPGMKLDAVNGRRFTKARLRAAIKATRPGGPVRSEAARTRGETTHKGVPLELVVENGDFFRTAKLTYTAGLRYPRLERDAGKTDVLGQMIAPRAKR